MAIKQNDNQYLKDHQDATKLMYEVITIIKSYADAHTLIGNKSQADSQYTLIDLLKRIQKLYDKAFNNLYKLYYDNTIQNANNILEGILAGYKLRRQNE